MNRALLRLALLGLIGSAAAPTRLSAQPPPAPAPATDKKQAAMRYTEAGLTAAKLGDYDTAIDFYQKAYQLVPHPALIFNIAEAHRLAGRIDQALILYNRYLSDAPNGPLAQVARDQIAEITASKAEEARKAEEERMAAEARKAEEARRAEEARKAEEARLARERGAPPAGPPSGASGATPPQDTGSLEPAAPPGRNLRIAGIATSAGGVLGVAIGIGFGLHARTLSSELSKPLVFYDPSKVDAGHRANTIAIIGIAGGTALIATGAALYWWGYTQSRPTERVSLAPIVSDQLAGLVVAGTWQ